MKADIRGTINAIGKIERIIGFALIFRKGEIPLSKPDKVPSFCPAGKVISVKIRPPCVYLIDIEACQIEHLCLEFQKIHYFISILQQI